MPYLEALQGGKRINAAFEDDGVSEFHMSHPSVGNDSLEQIRPLYGSE